KALGCITDNTDFALIAAGRAFTRPATRGDPEIPDPAVTIGAAGAALSERELECLRWVSLGKTAWETATIMGRSQRTVEFHLI
ncbi:helix-turn-helix domain-containing protein, partial [Citrobacter freundii]|uniref:helix-turn-helix domain-containing protein n=3 Tax=Pseudomonadota TaxID=1224 RepID=UPI001952E0CC